jgi:hypothetical protein
MRLKPTQISPGLFRPSHIHFPKEGRAGEALGGARSAAYREFLARLPSQSAIAVAASGSYSWLVDDMERSVRRPKLCNPLRRLKDLGVTRVLRFSTRSFASLRGVTLIAGRGELSASHPEVIQRVSTPPTESGRHRFVARRPRCSILLFSTWSAISVFPSSKGSRRHNRRRPPCPRARR